MHSVTQDQELRRELLFRALESCLDPEAALDMAIRMERFILQGSDGGRDDAPSPGEGGPAEAPAPDETRTAIERRRWAAEDDRALRRLWDAELSVEEIAQRLGRTPPSIYGRLRWFGLNQARARGREAGDGDAAQGERPPTIDEEISGRPVTADTVVRFLRSRDYSVVRTRDGRYQLDGHEVLTAQELLRKANRVRQTLGRPSWPTLRPAAELGPGAPTSGPD
jgi:hypothetical protein